jgi:hypothetical protein
MCIFKSCKNREYCSRRSNPWVDWNVCDVYLKYIGQDHVYQREVPFSSLGGNVDEINDESENKLHTSTEDKKNLVYKLYFVDRRSVKYISIHLGIPEITIYKTIDKAKRILGIRPQK